MLRMVMTMKIIITMTAMRIVMTMKIIIMMIVMKTVMLLLMAAGG